MQEAEVVCVFAHEDCDSVEPASADLARKIEAALCDLGCPVHAVTPAWETEAWLFLWPSAVAKYRPGWRQLPTSARDTGQIDKAKEQLRRELRPSGKASGRVRDYQESDAPAIAMIVRQMGLANAPVARSESYDRFRDRVLLCCQSLRDVAGSPHRQRGIAASR